MNSVRESIPVESILRAYMDETDEQDVEVNEVEEQIPIEEEAPLAKINSTEVELSNEEANSIIDDKQPSNIQVNETSINTQLEDTSQSRLSFSDIDKAVDTTGKESLIEAPKTIERLESLAALNIGNNDDDDDDDERIKIGGNVDLDITDVNNLDRSVSVLPPPILDDVEILQ